MQESSATDATPNIPIVAAVPTRRTAPPANYRNSRKRSEMILAGCKKRSGGCRFPAAQQFDLRQQPAFRAKQPLPNFHQQCEPRARNCVSTIAERTGTATGDQTWRRTEREDRSADLRRWIRKSSAKSRAKAARRATAAGARAAPAADLLIIDEGAERVSTARRFPAGATRGRGWR